MATLLYVFPHPDDESFGPGPAIARQVREGHAVHLLTLTRGGATRERHRLGLSVEAMGAVREREMAGVAEALGLASLAVLDLPDGGLAALDPREVERPIAEAVRRLRPDVLASYDVFGNSGHPDHLVTYAAARRLFHALRDAEPEAAPRRYAGFTVLDDQLADAPGHLRGVPRERAGAVVTFTAADRAAGERALACYATYADVVARHRPLDTVASGVGFVLAGEHPAPPLDDLTAGLG